MWNASWIDRAELGRVLHQIIMLGAVARDADGVGFLERVGADQRGRHLAGDDDHRDRIHQRVGDAGDRVGRARAGGDEHDAGLAGRAGIAFGRVRRRLLVADEDVADAVLLEQRVVDRQHRAAGIAEHDLHAEIAQRLDQDIGSALLVSSICLPWLRHCRSAIALQEARAANRTKTDMSTANRVILYFYLMKSISIISVSIMRAQSSGRLVAEPGILPLGILARRRLRRGRSASSRVDLASAAAGDLGHADRAADRRVERHDRSRASSAATSSTAPSSSIAAKRRSMRSTSQSRSGQQDQRRAGRSASPIPPDALVLPVGDRLAGRADHLERAGDAGGVGWR